MLMQIVQHNQTHHQVIIHRQRIITPHQVQITIHHQVVAAAIMEEVIVVVAAEEGSSPSQPTTVS
jgi:hypothetical protein